MFTMNKNVKPTRNWFTTITAAIIGVIVLGISLLVLPVTSVSEGLTFGTGSLLVVICALVAYEGKKGAVKELIHSFTFWR